MERKPIAIDLFCGAGGLSEGFRQAGYHIACGIDMDRDAGMTFQKNFPEATFIQEDITKLWVILASYSYEIFLYIMKISV